MIPGSANPLLLATPATAGGLQIERSLRFNSSDSAYLSRAVTSTGNRTTFTISLWAKRSALTGYQRFFSSLASGRQFLYRYNTDNTLVFEDSVTSSSFTTSQVIRDPSAWGHIVLAIDTTQATASNRIKAYFNGTQITTFSSITYPSPSANTSVNLSGDTMYLGGDTTGEYLNAYLANIHFIDGQQLTPSSFTETDATTGQLIPKTYSGSYGTNGFNLLFADNSAATASTLGKDTSGLGNNFTPNNLSVTAGAGNDSLVDSPTNYGTDTYVGGEVRGNYATWNPLDIPSSTSLANGNLDFTNSASATWKSVVSTISVSSGKYYCEFTPGGNSGLAFVGIIKAAWNANIADSRFWADTFGYGYYSDDGQKYNSGSGASYGAVYTNNDIIGVALDLDAGTLVFYKNGASQGTAYSGLSGTFKFCAARQSSGQTVVANFGQRAFAYTAPSGFKALNTQNLPAPLVTKSNTVFDIALWTGNVTARSITGLNYSPDLVWIKGRSPAANHFLFDTVRGATNRICSSLTVAEASEPTTLTSFNSDGFSLGTDAGVGACNQSGQTYVGWAWDAGTSTVTNTQGSITSQVRANVTAGFSIVSWTGNGTLNASVGHGLGVLPKLRITKNRTTGSTNWPTHTTVIDGSLDFFSLNTTAAKGDSGENTDTSSVFHIYGDTAYGASGQNYITYCFAPVVGYSSFGSFVPNGTADSSFVYCGFRPRFFLIKNTSATSNWIAWDTARDSYNYASKELYPNLSDAEVVNSSTYSLDILSNGFKVRNPGLGSGGTWIFAAWAEMPFNYSRAR